MPGIQNGLDRLLGKLMQLEPGKPAWHLCKYITPRDFRNPAQQHPVLVLYLDAIRWEASRTAGEDIPVVVTSDYREGDDDSTHGTKPCTGADIRCKSSLHRFHLLKAAFSLGLTRIGVYCDDEHLHVDIGDKIPGLVQASSGNPFPTEVCWIRECK